MENNTTEICHQCMIIEESIHRAISYKEYRSLVEQHVQNGTSSGPVQNEGLAQYTQLNHSRMRRLDKTIAIDHSNLERLSEFKGRHTWLVITESWCGDAAQVLPIMNKVAELSSDIELKVVLRDEHPELMDEFLTHGSRSIPKLIAYDCEHHEIIAEWGPRPKEATDMVREYVGRYGNLSPEFKKDLQIWYNKDKGQSIIEELVDLLGD